MREKNHVPRDDRIMVVVHTPRFFFFFCFSSYRVINREIKKMVDGPCRNRLFRVGEPSVQQCSVCLWCGFQQAYSQYIPATRAQVTGAQGGQTGAAMDGTYLVEASF